LAPREIAYEFVHEGSHVQLILDFGDGCLDFAVGNPFENGKQLQVFLRCQVGEDDVLLWTNADLFPVLLQKALIIRVVLEMDAALVDSGLADQSADQGGLACSVGAQQHGDVVLEQVHGHVVECVHHGAIVLLEQVTDAHQLFAVQFGCLLRIQFLPVLECGVLSHDFLHI